MIDLSLLRSLFEDEQMIQKYLLVFRKDVPLSMRELKEKIEHLDWEDASIIAHSLKSQLQYLNETEASNTAYVIEKLCDPTMLPNTLEVMGKYRVLEAMLDHIFNKIEALI